MRTSRRTFLKRAVVFTGLLYVPSGILKPRAWLFNPVEDRFVPFERLRGLQAASAIKARTFSSIEDKRIQLANSNFARLWASSLGTSWTKVRIGCRASMGDTGANLSGTPNFAFGICSGTSNIYFDATTTHWCGLKSTDSSWLRVTSSPAAYAMSNATTPPQITKKVNTTVTIGGAWDQSPRLINVTTENRSCLFADITKGSPNFTVALFSRNVNTASDVTLETYLTNVELSSPSVTNHIMSNNQTQAIDEATNGYFNAVNIGWDRTSPVIELSDIAVVKIS